MYGTLSSQNGSSPYTTNTRTPQSRSRSSSVQQGQVLSRRGTLSERDQRERDRTRITKRRSMTKNMVGLLTAGSSVTTVGRGDAATRLSSDDSVQVVEDLDEFATNGKKRKSVVMDEEDGVPLGLRVGVTMDRQSGGKIAAKGDGGSSGGGSETIKRRKRKSKIRPKSQVLFVGAAVRRSIVGLGDFGLGLEVSEKGSGVDDKKAGLEKVDDEWEETGVVGAEIEEGGNGVIVESVVDAVDSVADDVSMVRKKSSKGKGKSGTEPRLKKKGSKKVKNAQGEDGINEVPTMDGTAATTRRLRKVKRVKDLGGQDVTLERGNPSLSRTISSSMSKSTNPGMAMTESYSSTLSSLDVPTYENTMIQSVTQQQQQQQQQQPLQLRPRQPVVPLIERDLKGDSMMVDEAQVQLMLADAIRILQGFEGSVSSGDADSDRDGERVSSSGVGRGKDGVSTRVVGEQAER
ncbi:hypothetical protein HDU76_009678 [Blyttiomyces sp. JEL0837]|nr:hypothetical protein HDU76_009678 [Blyttiomyces sp. JEL0837]